MNRNTANVNGYATPQQPTRSGNAYYVTHDARGPARLSTTLVHALADIAGADVTQVEFTLFDGIDPAALDSLFRSGSDDTPRFGGHVSFTVWGYRVTVYDTGQIVINAPVSHAAGR